MNLSTFIVLSLVVLGVLLVIVRGILNRRKGKKPCSCSCSGCALKDTCHPPKE